MKRVPQYGHQVSRPLQHLYIARSCAALNGLRLNYALPFVTIIPQTISLGVTIMPSQADISLETSLSFPHIRTSCEPSHLLSSSSHTLASPPSLYVTFKVLQLLNTFRKRVKTRVHTTQSRRRRQASKKVTEDFCQGFERQAFEEIDRYLGRKTAYPTLKRRKTGVPNLQGDQGSKPSRVTAVLEEEDSSRNIEW